MINFAKFINNFLFIMKTKFLLLFLFVTFQSSGQTIVASYEFPRFNSYNYFWGIVEVNDTFWIGSDYNSTSGVYQNSWTYKITKGGQILDSIQTPIQSNHGLEWYDDHFWLVEGYRAQGSRIFKMDINGAFVDTFVVPTVIGGIPIGIGDVALDGNKMWFSIYSPDFTSYPQGYAYAFDLTTRQLVDTIPLHGRQVLGMAVKGDTIFYVNENQYTNETERIYAYSKSTGDTIFSFPAPDPDGNCNPKGLYWDGEHLWLVAERIGNSQWVYKAIYKYAITGEGNPTIATSVNNIDFGNGIIGLVSAKNFSIQNIGTADLIIDDFVFESFNQSFSTNHIFPDTLAPGINKDYEILFNPVNFDSTFGILKIFSNDGGTPVKAIGLKGKGVYNGSYLYTTASNFSFGERRINSLNGYEFIIQNRGTEILAINSITTNTQQFFLDTTGIIFPVLLDSLTSVEFRIWFNPTGITEYGDTITILSNSVNQPQFNFVIDGTGLEEHTSLGDVMWQSSVPFNPFAYTNDFKPMSMKRIEDVNGDSIDDIIVASRNYYVICYNGNSSVEGDILWKFNTGYNNNNTGAVMFENSLQVRSDVDGDGVQDVVFGCGGGNEFVYTVSGRSGKLIWAYGDSVNYNNGDINGIRADKDFNNDGVNDVLVSASGSSSGGRHSVICLNGLTGEEIFNSIQNASYTFDITTRTDGGAIGVDLGNGGPYLINGFDNSGNLTWASNAPEVVWSLMEINDITEDGKKDIAAFSGGLNVKVYVIDASNGEIIWQNGYPQFATFATIDVISDLNNNGFSDIIFSGKEGIYRLDTKDGQTIWSNTLDNIYTFGVEELGDLNIDGVNEIAAGTMGGNLYILNGVDGAIIHQNNFGTSPDHSVERIVVLPSIDHNYSTDYVVAVRDGRIICYSGGPEEPVSVDDQMVVNTYSLEQNYPNPFNPATKIKFQIVHSQFTSLNVYDVLGKKVAVLVNETKSPGVYEVEFDGSKFSSGVYFYTLTAGDFIETKKFLLLK